MIRTTLAGFLSVASAARTVLAKGWAAATLLALLTQFTYVALLVILILAGLGVPIPEDIPLVLSGYMCNKVHSPIAQVQMVDTNGDGIPDTVVEPERKVPRLHWMILAGMVGVLVGDSIIFSIGRHGIESNSLVARHLRKVMNTRRREKVERHFATHGNLTVFVGRFAPGFRSIVFAFAGLSKMSYTRFIIIDGLAAAISVPAFILLGWRFAAHIVIIGIWISKIKLLLLPVAAVLLVGGAALYYVRRRRRRLAAMTRV